MQSNTLKISKLSIITVSGMIYMFFSPLEAFVTGNSGSMLKYFTILYILIIFVSIGIRKQKVGFSLFDGILISFAVIYLTSLLWSKYPERGTYYVNSIGLQVILIFSMRKINFKIKDIRLLIYGYIFGSVILTLLIITNPTLVGSFSNRYSIVIKGQTIDPNNIAALIVTGFAMLYMMKIYNRKLFFLKLFVLVLMIIAMLMTGSRGGIIALFCVLIYCESTKKSFKQVFKGLLGIFILVGIVAVIDTQLDTMNFIENIFNRFNDTGGSNRIIIWSVAIKAILEKPIIGYGVGTSPYIIDQGIGSIIGSHNTFLTILLDTGILGIIPFSIMIIYCLKNKPVNDYEYARKAALITIIVAMCFFDAYNKKVFWAVYLLNTLVVERKNKNEYNAFWM